MTPQVLGQNWWDGNAGPAPVAPVPSPLPTLLPPNATSSERAVESAAWRLGDDGPQGIRSLWNPETIPAPFLPWLAWAMAVDAWDTTQSEELRRASIARSFALHRIKGTLEGYRVLARLYGARIVKVDRPPSALIAGRSKTEADRDAELRKLPQVRIQYAAATPPLKPAGGFCIGDALSPNRFLVPTPVYVPQAFLYQDGQQIPLTTRVVAGSGSNEALIEVRMRSTAKHALICGGPLREGPWLQLIRSGMSISFRRGTATNLGPTSGTRRPFRDSHRTMCIRIGSR